MAPVTAPVMASVLVLVSDPALDCHRALSMHPCDERLRLGLISNELEWTDTQRELAHHCQGSEDWGCFKHDTVGIGWQEFLFYKSTKDIYVSLRSHLLLRDTTSSEIRDLWQSMLITGKALIKYGRPLRVFMPCRVFMIEDATVLDDFGTFDDAPDHADSVPQQRQHPITPTMSTSGGDSERCGNEAASSSTTTPPDQADNEHKRRRL